MENELEKNFISLKNRIWTSYKTRINTAERLKKKNEFIAFLSIYYSAILASVSILNYVNKSNNMDVISIVMSVIVTMLFMYFEGKNYKERYIKMKENYIDINLLYYKIENDIQLKEINKGNYNKFSDEYIKLLNNVENHSEMDYIKYKINDKDCIKNSNDKIKYYLWSFSIMFIKLFVFCIPTIILIIAICQLIIF